MRNIYEVFEKFPDGSTLWRMSVRGRFEANRKKDELAERSPNEFFIIDVQAAEVLEPRVSTRSSAPGNNSLFSPLRLPGKGV